MELFGGQNSVRKSKSYFFSSSKKGFTLTLVEGATTNGVGPNSTSNSPSVLISFLMLLWESGLGNFREAAVGNAITLAITVFTPKKLYYRIKIVSLSKIKPRQRGGRTDGHPHLPEFGLLPHFTHWPA